MRKEDILKLLRAEKGYVSGEKISERLGISRTAVWKHINSLKKEGYNISSVSRRGYIFKESDILNADEIADRLKTEIIGKEIVFVSETDSTNNMAKRNSERGDGTVFAADRQTAGRGRSGKKWLSADSGGKDVPVPDQHVGISVLLPGKHPQHLRRFQKVLLSLPLHGKVQSGRREVIGEPQQEYQ